MVGVGFKDGVEVETGHAERAQIGEFFGNSREVAAKIVRIGDLSILIREVFGQFVPVLVYPAVGRHILFLLGGFTEPVRENLVHHPGFQEIGGFEVPVVDGELPHVIPM